MRLPIQSAGALVAMAMLATGTAGTSQAAVLYSFEGTSTQGFYDAGKYAISELTYLMKWTAIFDDFVTTGGFGSPSASYESCSVTLTGFTSFPVTKNCGTGVTLSHDGAPYEDGVGMLFYFPDYSNYGGIPIGENIPVFFATGAFGQPGTYLGEIRGNLTGTGTMTVKDLSVVDPGVEPGAVPVPAAFPLLAAALGAFGLVARRRRG